MSGKDEGVSWDVAVWVVLVITWVLGSFILQAQAGQWAIFGVGVAIFAMPIVTGLYKGLAESGENKRDA